MSVYTAQSDFSEIWCAPSLTEEILQHCSLTSEGWSTDSTCSMESYQNGNERDSFDVSSLDHLFNNEENVPTTTLTTLNCPQLSNDIQAFQPAWPETNFVGEAYTETSPSNVSQMNGPGIQYQCTIPNELPVTSFDDDLSLSDLEVSDNEFDAADIESFSDCSSSSVNHEPQYSCFDAFSTHASSFSVPAFSQCNSPHANDVDHEGDMTYPSRKPRQPILHNFLFKALENPKQYGNMIKWVDRSSGLFEFNSKNKESLARAWGKAKNNRCPMTYQKMARALRIYIKKGTVMRKVKRKLRYTFLPEYLQKALKEACALQYST
ncbi:unnamed protein product [Clavelina lepadiformis]|uniref:ETS domain-containing protein n=1 Tax=Clavelina lepadiformis TaxID=159417 RepID=A0ABP0EYH0_CLALP